MTSRSTVSHRGVGWLLAEWFWPLCLALVALGLDFYFYTGFYMSDDAEYLRSIQRLASLSGVPTSLGGSRVALLLPAALVYAVTGSVTATILSYCLYHPLLVVLGYVAGRMVFDRSSAVVGAALVALSPIYYVFAGAILPDNCLSFWLGGLLVLVLWITTHAEPTALSARTEQALWGVAGLLTGIAYSVKETGLIMTVPVSAIIVLTTVRRKGLVYALRCVAIYGLGLFACLLAETLVLSATSGHWVVRLATGVGSADVESMFLRRVSQQGLLPIERLEYWYRKVIAYFGWELWLMPLTNLVALFAFRGRARVHVALLTPFWLWPFLFLTFGTTSFSHYLPPSIQARYYAVCLLPLLLIAGATATWLVRLLRRRLADVPGWVRAPIAQLPLLVLAVWMCALFVRVEPRSGIIYRAASARAVLEAFRDARMLYPKQRVVLSDFLFGRLSPLVAARKCEKCPPIGRLSRARVVEDLPPRPFVIIFAGEKADRLGPLLRRLEKRGDIRLTRSGLGTYAAPQGLRSTLHAALFPLLGSFDEPNWPTVGKESFAYSYLVRDPKGS